MMQEKCEKGIGLIKEKADIITEEQEKLLWENALDIGSVYSRYLVVSSSVLF
jgi:hypothetical protein